MGARESANWRNMSSPLDSKIELSIESTASGRYGGKADASASGNRLRWRLHDGASDHRPRSFSGARNRRYVDVIVEVASYAEYARFSKRLRNLGFSEDSSEGAPICRWLIDRMKLAVMPTDETILWCLEPLVQA